VIKRPSPALIVAALALFLALVGTGVAANSAHVAAHKKKHHNPPTLTSGGVNKLIAAFLLHHPHAGPVGPRGATGGTGPQGPGAKQIVVINSGTRTPFKVAAIGPWTVNLECAGAADVNIVGPGSFFATTVTGDPAPPGTSPPPGIAAVDNRALGNGFTTGTDSISTTHPRRQESADIELISGSTMYELHLQMGAETVAGSPTGTCNLVGSATPVTG
jgi:hypothetical protein